MEEKVTQSGSIISYRGGLQNDIFIEYFLSNNRYFLLFHASLLYTISKED